MGGMAFALIVFLVPLAALAILGGLILAGIKMLKGNPSKQSRQQWDEETRLIQELHQNLSRMEKRIEALENGPLRVGAFMSLMEPRGSAVRAWVKLEDGTSVFPAVRARCIDRGIDMPAMNRKAGSR